MKKIIALPIITVALLASASANAQVSVGVNFGAPVVAEPVYPAPVYAEPGYAVAPDWPSEHYDHHRHGHNDYWAHHMPRGHVDAHRR